jgi:hypothetical protein
MNIIPKDSRPALHTDFYNLRDSYHPLKDAPKPGPHSFSTFTENSES